MTSGSKSNWKLKVEILKNGLWENGLHQKNLLNAIWKSWNYFDQEYCFKLLKSMSERIKAVIKARGGAN